jgi:hypothetical protein
VQFYNFTANSIASGVSYIVGKIRQMESEGIQYRDIRRILNIFYCKADAREENLYNHGM